MKKEITLKIKSVERKIRKIIDLVECDECVEKIIVQTSKAKRMLLSVKHMILKDYLIKIAEQNGLSKKEILSNYNLIK